jgi:hypothetical protein
MKPSEIKNKDPFLFQISGLPSVLERKKEEKTYATHPGTDSKTFFG